MPASAISHAPHVPRQRQSIHLLLCLHPLQTDEELAQCIRKSGILPYFALSWYITWFAHDVHQLPQIARLFDLFMASHPIMPLYVGAVAMKVDFCEAANDIYTFRHKSACLPSL